VSRVGKEPIEVPQGVEVKIDGNQIEVKGPKGSLNRGVHPSIMLGLNDRELVVSRPSDSTLHKSLHGLTRTLVSNMVKGVTVGFQKKLEISGVGYRAELQGQSVIFQLGYSHAIVFRLPQGIAIEIEKGTRLTVSGIDKQLVGQVAAKIHSFRSPDPYKGKGIRYEGEHIRRKAGKTAG
jgi:large subunit ribosomal protein L6